MNETKYCQTCGTEINKKAEICPKCGVRIMSSKTGILNTVLSGGMYLWGIFICFGGLFELIDGMLVTAILAGTAGIISLPFIRDYIASRMNMRRIGGITAFIISFVLLIVVVSISPPVPNESIYTENMAVPTSTPIVTPTPTVTPTQEATPVESDLSIGDKVSSHGTDIAITDMTITDHYYWTGSSGSAYAKYPERGNIFIIIVCNIKRTGDSSRHYYSQNFWLIDSEGYRYDREIYYGDNELERIQELHTGQQTQGVLLFEVPISTSELKAQYEFKGLFSSDIVSWTIYP